MDGTDIERSHECVAAVVLCVFSSTLFNARCSSFKLLFLSFSGTLLETKHACNINSHKEYKVIVVAYCSSCPFVVVCLNAWRCGLPPNMPRAVAVVLLLARDIINGVVYSRVLGACRAATDWIVVMTSNENSNNESSSVRQQQ